MSDIFDEVDEILNEIDGEFDASEMTEAEDYPEAMEDDKSFNESELMDIMAEIEGLEQDFVAAEEVVAVAKPMVAVVAKTELQNEIDRELEMSFVEKEEEELAQATPAVLTFEKKTTAQPTQAVAASSEISFEAHGQMNLNLGFKIGEENAKLTIDPVRGMVVTMSGVELRINQEDGCIVTMENGVKFTIPLTSSESNLKKKSA